MNDEDERVEPAIMMTMFYDTASFIVYELTIHADHVPA